MVMIIGGRKGNQMFKRSKYILNGWIFILSSLLLVQCAVPGLTADMGEVELGKSPGAWVDAPLNGAEVPPGTAIKVMGHVDEAVGRAVLFINNVDSGLPGVQVPGKHPPAFEWDWTPMDPGIYDLRVGNSSGPLSSTVRVTVSGEMTFEAEFWVDETSLMFGDCTSLHWTTTNAISVELDAEPVSFSGDQGICPEEDSEYVLNVMYMDESSEELRVSIVVVRDTVTPTPTSTPTITATPTQTVTPTKTTPPPVIIVTTLPPPSDTTPPPVPGGLSPCGSIKRPYEFKSNCSGSVTLSWGAVSDPSGISQYVVTVKNIKTGATSEYYTSATSFTVTGIYDGVTYGFMVRAQDGAGNWSANSAMCYFKCPIIVY